MEEKKDWLGEKGGKSKRRIGGNHVECERRKNREDNYKTKRERGKRRKRGRHATFGDFCTFGTLAL